ncbi:MAG: efflux RND transporter periplasmic adaptor subunit [Burkholderiaceae bacterium]
MKKTSFYYPALLAAVSLLSLLATAMPAHAGGDASDGHSHDAAPASAGANAPQRLPGGDVFLPKRSQRQLGVRTVLAEASNLPKTIELSGRVVMDPNASGRVQPTIAGRLEAGPRGLPALGQAVRKGEVLAVVRASASPIERANQIAQSAELRANLDLAHKRVARLAQLEGTVAQKDVDAARGEVTSLEQRLAAVQASVSATELLLAPASGVIAARNAALGQVMEARELLFEIVDPTRLMVEANAFDAALISNIGSASIALPSPPSPSSTTGSSAISIPLQFAGAGRSLREGAIPLQFRTAGTAALALAIHQPVRVVVQTKELAQGFAVASAAVAKNTSNQDIVWVHTEAEVFSPRTVRLIALDGARIAVLDGLKAGDRVVTQGAALLNQVR